MSLGPRATDLVWEAGIVGSRGERVVLLFEHKSWSDPGVGRQLFGYMLRIRDHVARSGPEESPLPVVLPTLFHAAGDLRRPRRGGAQSGGQEGTRGGVTNRS